MENNNTVNEVETKIEELKIDESNFDKKLDSYVDLEKSRGDLFSDVLSNKKDFNYLSSDSKNSSTNTSYQDLPSNFLHETQIEKEAETLDLDKKLNLNDSNLNFNTKCLDYLSKEPISKSTKTDNSDTISYDFKKDLDKSKVITDPFLATNFSTRTSFYSPPKSSLDIDFKHIDSYRYGTYTRDLELNKKPYLEHITPLDDYKYTPKTNAYNYTIKTDTAKSAFESDSDVLLHQKTSNEKLPICAVTQKYLSFNNLVIPDYKKLDDFKETKFENDFLNIFSLKIKKNFNNIDENKNSVQNNKTANFYLNSEDNSKHDDTIESDHLNSDYAKGPIFPSEVYGSRPGLELSFKEGIYNRKPVQASKKIDLIESEQLKQMDKKLKKLIKKNLKQDFKSHFQSENLLDSNKISWEIPIEDNQDQINESCSTATAGPNYSYLPLKDVPVHDFVKKLREEFEYEDCDLTKIPAGLNDAYKKFENKFNQSQESFTKNNKVNLENFIKNPAKVVLENIDKDVVDVVKKDLIKEEKESNETKNESLNKKNKIKELILNQQIKHEKRIKTLENLIKIEKLQAQKLKKILELNKAEDFDFIYESYLKNSNIFNDQSKIDDEYLIKLEDEKILLDENLKQLNQEESMIAESNDDTISSCNEPINESGIESCEEKNHTEAQPEKKDFESQNTTWFLPINKPNINFNQNVKKTVNFEYDLFDKKMSLQDAFQMHKFDFLKNSKNRVRDIKLKAARRQVASELKLNNYQALEEKYSKIKNLEKETNKKYNYFTIDKPIYSKHRQTMSSQEIKEQTKKKYQKLPEVQQKQLKQKLEENKIKNRIKSNIFKKTIQQKVLTSGPNFNLNYKALENRI